MQIDIDKLRALAKLRVVLSVPGMEDVEVRRNLSYGAESDSDRVMDVYWPPERDGALPAVLFVNGFGKTPAAELLGFGFKDMGSYVSWGRLAAASGFVGITYSCIEPPADARAALGFVRENADSLGVDPERIGIWATSGNGPTALSLVMDDSTRLCFAVLNNTYTLDSGGTSSVADMAAQFGFAMPVSGKTVRDIDTGVSVLAIRSGKDEVPGLNEAFDDFIAQALEANLAIQIENLPDAPHSFDTLHNTPDARQTIRRIIAFMQAAATERRTR